MDVLFRCGKASAAEVQSELAEAPSYSAVRTLLRILEDKGHVEHEADGSRYIYRPKTNQQDAQKSALTHLMQTFFEGSASKVVSALVNHGEKISPEELEEIATLVAGARKEGKS